MARDDAEALRKRLYGPGASAEDVALYRAVAADAPPVAVDVAPADRAVPEADEPGPSPTRAGRRGRVAAIAVVLVVLAGLGVAGVRVVQAQQPDPRTPPSLLETDRVEREAFQQNLALGNHAGIAAYLVTHPHPIDLPGATRYFTIERDGVGAGTVDLAPVPAETVEGRATVLLVVGGDAVVGWDVYRRRVDSTGEQQYARQLRRGGEQSAGLLTATTFRYRPGDRPVRLVLDVPDGVRWGAAVVLSD